MISLPTHTITLAAGVVASSYTFFTNLGETQRGIIPLINNALGPIDMTSEARARAWALYFMPGRISAIGGTVLTSLINLTTSYLHPSPLISRLTLSAGLIGITMIPLTLVMGLPKINDELLKIDKAGGGGLKVSVLTKRWMQLHRFRYVSLVGAWGLSFAALVMDGRII